MRERDRLRTEHEPFNCSIEQAANGFIIRVGYLNMGPPGMSTRSGVQLAPDIEAVCSFLRGYFEEPSE